MKQVVYSLLFVFIFVGSGTAQTYPLRVLQFNIWQEGTTVPGGFDGVVEEIARLQPDLVALSEVRNYNNTRFHERIVTALKAKGLTYYSFYSDDTGILSKYPLIEYGPLGKKDIDFRGTIHKVVVKHESGKEITFYTVHLQYTKAANYLPRAYDADTWEKLPAPVLSADSIIQNNKLSTRDEAIAAFIKDARQETKKGRLVFLGGDFNEPSHLDWTKRTKNLFDHHGQIVPWNNTLSLQKNGFIDAYRKQFPNEVSHPGFTFPAYITTVPTKKLVWAPDADERDRIDFIFYRKNKAVRLKDVTIVGPKESILKGQPVTEATKDPFLLPQGNWPTDHKALLADFVIKK